MAEVSLTDRMLSERAEVFQAMVNHRFVLDIEADRLPAEVFDRYLLIEGAFVETAIAIFGYAVAKSEDLADRRKFISELDALANQQMPYFETTFASRGIRPDPALQADPTVAAFRDGMLAIGRDGEFPAIITAMFATEWMYWTWCARAHRARISDAMIRDWVRLHAEPDFAAQAGWLKARLDVLGTKMSEVEKADAIDVFGSIQALEIDFHEAAYASPSQSRISAE